MDDSDQIYLHFGISLKQVATDDPDGLEKSFR